MSTYQAVVEALGLLERDTPLRAALLAPLALLTAHQAAFDPSVASRMAGKKEGEERKRQENYAQQKERVDQLKKDREEQRFKEK